MELSSGVFHNPPLGPVAAPAPKLLPADFSDLVAASGRGLGSAEFDLALGLDSDSLGCDDRRAHAHPSIHRMTRDFIGAALATALFAIHPIHTEAVAWILDLVRR